MAVKSFFNKPIDERLSPVTFFVTMASIFGLFLIILTPPFQGSDEPLHFYRAYDISEFNWVVDRNEGDDSGGVLPKSLYRTVLLTTNNSSLGNLKPDEKYQLSKTKLALAIDHNPDNREWINFTATALYAPIAYIPQAIGIYVARTLDAPPLAMMYMGRLMNLTAWIIFFAVAIRLIPIKKWVVVFVGLLPVALSQAGSLSADVVTTGSFAVFLSAVFYLMTRKNPVTSVQYASLLTTAAVMVLCKQLMLVLLPLALLVPNKVFSRNNRKAYFMKAAVIGAPIVLYSVWMYIMRGVDMKSVFSRNQNPSEQIHLVLQDPFVFVSAFLNTHLSTFGDTITHSFMGTFGWGDPSLPEYIVIAGYIGLFLVLVADEVKGPFISFINNKQKLFVSALALGYFGAVSAALYAYYNPVGASVIAGIQGRYLFPLALLMVPLLQSNWLIVSRKSYLYIATLIPLFLLTASLATIYERYYIS